VPKALTTPSQAAAPSASISDAELRVMEVLWQRETPAALSADEIAAALAGQQDWQISTVKTLLGRLLRKAAVSAARDENNARRFLYLPVLQRQAWLKSQSLSLLDRWFDGRLAPLVAHFASHRKLKRADLDALRQLLKEHDGV
jgi:BlaI family transcriptional regulator, penicillinase repressor